MDRLLEHLQVVDTKNRYTVLVRPNDDWQPTAGNFKTLICDYKQFSFNLLDQLTFARYLKNLEPDLVHFGMTPQEPVFFQGARVTTTHDLTMLWFARAGRLPEWLHKLRMVGYRWLLQASLKKASRVIVPTEFVKQDVSKYEPSTATKITVTLEASEPPLAIDAKRPEIVNLDKFILYVGSAFPHKNLETLIKSFEILHTSQPELKLILAGKRELYYQQIEKLAELSPARANIVFTGFVSDAELKWLYENAQAYVFPSLSEGFGLPGLEAMVHGCPVVSSNATCLPEVYGDAAVYFGPNNSQDMADKIASVLSDEKLRQSLIQKGYVQAKKYSWRRMAEQTLEVYQEVLKENR
ncbi:glycosyltransferase family 4 protein [Candidatus Saccharibacteria bacterium]|nr:glycosyltransferase family 4 protein [Candidatus Saccharibacteria bacterium]